MKHLTASLLRILALVAGLTNICVAATTNTDRSDIQRELSKPQIRGSIVYKAYCTLCHGDQGKGQSRYSKIYDKDEIGRAHV